MASNDEKPATELNGELVADYSQDASPSSSSSQPAKADRIYVDNSNLAELKTTCDEAVERILTRSATSNTPAKSPAATSPTSSSTDVTSTEGSSSVASSEFPPFKASHFHTDLRLVIGYLGSFVIVGVSLWSYFVEKDWQKNKGPTAVAVGIYVILSALYGLDSYLQGDRIFTGKRKMLSKRIETEVLIIVSPSLPKPTIDPSSVSSSRKTIIPPIYTLQVEYTRRSNGGKSLLKKVQDKITLGHLGEWFTEEGEFVEAIFQQKLLNGLSKCWTEKDE